MARRHGRHKNRSTAGPAGFAGLEAAWESAGSSEPSDSQAAESRSAEDASEQAAPSHQSAGEFEVLAASILASPDEALSLLERAEILSYQVVPAGTNYTFAAVLSSGGGRFLGIYKPQRGERPLWDFPRGLHQRERAAYLAARFLGWPNVPPTMVRDGPLGVGMLQLYVPTMERWDFAELQRQHRREMLEIALFDLLANNADRKAGHCLLGTDGKVWAIDHGLTFHADPKLRTVLWDYCGEPVPRRLFDDLESLRDDPARREAFRALLAPYLSHAEMQALFRRLEAILRAGRYPHLDPERNIPWPLV